LASRACFHSTTPEEPSFGAPIRGIGGGGGWSSARAICNCVCVRVCCLLEP
jgi:hypothetical protein